MVGRKVRSKICPSLFGKIIKVYEDDVYLAAINGLQVKTMVISLKYWEVI